MSKIVSQFFISVDGVIESPEKWHFAYWNDEMKDAVASELDHADALLLGRRTYDVYAASWPTRGSDTLFADRINAMPKLVASTTLDTATWQNTTIIGRDVSEELVKLKQRADTHITISGSPSLVRSLLRDGVLDELQLLIHPIVLGDGDRLFHHDRLRRGLELVSARTFHTGVLHAIYQPQYEPTT